MSQMYKWIDKTLNPIQGKCPYNCSYCYVPHLRVKKLYEGEPHLVNSFFKKNLGCGYSYFVGSCFDIFAEAIPDKWIIAILEHCRKYGSNQYLFQTKNPIRLLEFIDQYPENTILGTTIETNRIYNLIWKRFEGSVCPSVFDRYWDFKVVSSDKKFISIEPIMDFDIDIFVNKMIKKINPTFVSIGADSKHHNLPEPSWDKVQALIKELEKFTEVRIKDNLQRLLTRVK